MDNEIWLSSKNSSQSRHRHRHTLEKSRKRPHQLMSKEQIRKKTHTGRQLDRNYSRKSGQKLRKKTKGKKQQPLGFAFSKAQFKWTSCSCSNFHWQFFSFFVYFIVVKSSLQLASVLFRLFSLPFSRFVHLPPPPNSTIQLLSDRLWSCSCYCSAALQFDCSFTNLIPKTLRRRRRTVKEGNQKRQKKVVGISFSNRRRRLNLQCWKMKKKKRGKTKALAETKWHR